MSNFIHFKRRDNRKEFLEELENSTTLPADAWLLFCTTAKSGKTVEESIEALKADGWTLGTRGADQQFVATLSFGTMPSGIANWKVEITCDFPYRFATTYTYNHGKPPEWDIFGLDTDGLDESCKPMNGLLFEVMTSVLSNRQQAYDSKNHGVEEINDRTKSMEKENESLRSQLESMQSQMASLMQLIASSESSAKKSKKQ